MDLAVPRDIAFGLIGPNDHDLAGLLELAKVTPGSDPFSIELALPVERLAKLFAACRPRTPPPAPGAPAGPGPRGPGPTERRGAENPPAPRTPTPRRP